MERSLSLQQPWLHIAEGSYEARYVSITLPHTYTPPPSHPPPPPDIPLPPKIPRRRRSGAKTVQAPRNSDRCAICGW